MGDCWVIADLTKSLLFDWKKLKGYKGIKFFWI